MNFTNFNEQIIEVISEMEPIKAKDIAIILSNMRGEHITRRDVNSEIYGQLLGKIVQNDFFEWSIWKGAGPTHPHESEGTDHESEENKVTYDSKVKLECPRGPVPVFEMKFTKKNSENGISHEGFICYYYKSPLARAILGHAVGDICRPHGLNLSFTILEID